MKRRKTWELEPRFHCSLIGTCLQPDEQQRLGRKLGLPREDLADDYRLHVQLVGIVGERSGAARLINKYLDRKYRDTIQHLAQAADDASLEALWRQDLAKGRVSATYWALITHPSAGEDLLFRVYGEVHMLSHLSGASVRVDMQQLDGLQRQVPELRREAKDLRRELQSARQEKKQTLEEAKRLETELSAARRRNERLADHLARLQEETGLDDLRDQVEAYAAKLTDARVEKERALSEAREWCAQARHLQTWGKHLQETVDAAHQEKIALESTLEVLLAPACKGCEKAPDCPSALNLERRCILFVGGRNRQCAHFRALVEQGNGEFIHHDGGLAESQRHLAALLARADAVICPLDCVSHDAIHRIKRDCKRHGKPLKILPRSSLASFTRGLQDLAGTSRIPNPQREKHRC